MDVDRFNRLMVALVLAMILSAILALGRWEAVAAGIERDLSYQAGAPRE